MFLRMKRELFYVYAVLSLCSCSSTNLVKDAPIDYKKAERTLSVDKDSAFVQNFPQTLTCTDINVFNDSVMLLYDMVGNNGNNRFFKAYSLNDYSYIGEYICHGRGPDELLMPDLSGKVRDVAGGTIYGYIYDGMHGKSYRFDMNGHDGEKGCLLQVISELPPNTVYAFPYRDSLQLIMDIEDDKVLYHILDRQSDYSKTFNLFPDDISASRSISGLSNCVVINNSMGVAAMLMLAIPQVNFLNLQDGSVRSTAVDKRYKNWKDIIIPENDINALMESERYYIDAASTENHIIAIYADKTIEQNIKGDGPAPHIHIFDWNGAFLYDIAVNENITRIDYDSVRRYLYGVDVSAGQIYRYDLSGILD